ncbi:ATP-binding protein [Mucilaginibacter sp. E4BP6]|uniref:ATP-binding protein n=1 Tax=Mucilaginibacter sp. E4BP6 TaxID=2723089 RepID=UPI0015C995EA|nr:ATP-binding protein [Mucilaginibacter sp. E4BP6]NYE65429.1 light-regulated signal transduction histidine kinase (bacteriophytochrome) [Mucilaginibacter sp. E4BP6]
MSSYQVDLTNCDKEPIHIPGKIQSHGFLVAVNSTTQLITYISENIRHFINEDPKNYLGLNISKLESKLHISILQLSLGQVLKLGNNNQYFESTNPFYLEIDKKPYNLIISVSGDNYILEFETVESDLDFDIQKTIGRSVSEILSGKNISSLLQNAAQEIKNIILYDRVMIYRFGEDGHGEVVAEVRNDDLEPFLGLHYPASDIPKQARELYKINLTRIIADVNSESSSIITHQTEGAQLNLTHSALRAVSPIHIQYLKNMGVGSSFSISLIARGELWGLIACHNYSPRFINYKARDASKLIGQILSSALEYRQDEEDIEKAAKLNAAAVELATYIEKDNYITDALTRHSTTIQDITTASGAVIVFDNNITTIGITPSLDQINDIVNWLKVNMQDSVYYTHRFPEIFFQAQAYSSVASGILACMLSKELSEFIIWFKPEQLVSINWAGNPEKPVVDDGDGLLQLSPRKSFESWNQIVKNTSERWASGEIGAVIKVREQVMYAINRKANDIRLLNERLNLAYEELDTFSFTISHDLRTPLSSIKSYSELLLANNKSIDDSAKRILARIIVGTDKMNFLIKEILNYSRVGRAEMEFAPVNMGRLIHEIKNEVISALNPKNIEFEIGETPDLQGDATMLTQVFTNLINNAVKYSSRSNPSKVKVEGKINNDEIIYSVSDNGVGIDVNYYSRVFELFKRMDNVKDFEGTGVGLAIVKRIVEKHQARIWFESTLEVGTIFYISFKNL